MEYQASDQVCTIFRKPSKNTNLRKRSIIDTEDEEQDSATQGSTVVYKHKKPPKSDNNKLHFSTGSKKPSTFRFHFGSSKEIQVHHDSKATAALETETDFSRDSKAIRERVLKQTETTLKGKSFGDDKVYRGINGYIDYKAGFRREQTISGEKARGAHGPLRASPHIKVSTRFDYQPDICKDYQETGYCGFGDACKFMHDRGDYKSGWQMEREWDEGEKIRKRKLMGIEDRDDEGEENNYDDGDDSLPSFCLICRQAFVDPVVTKCKHYFCEHCALKHHAKNKKCFLCNQPTMGMFNSAHQIRKKIKTVDKT